jgi:Tfp pilus assembly protein PilP
MKKLILLLTLLLLLAACSGGSAGTPTPYPDTVDWETAVEILYTGEVEQVFQLHSLEVTFYMKDGSQIQTTEPTIDAIFQEVENCGAPCEGIMLATE